MISVTLNCSQTQPTLPPPYPPNILLCHILSHIVGQRNSSQELKHLPPYPPYPSSLPFSPWKPGDAYKLGGDNNLQTR